MSVIASIISGGQAGAQRAALDFAILHSIPHGGWCGQGRVALDGPLPEKYQLKETPTDNFMERTECNVSTADATVVFTFAPKATEGSQKALSFAKKQKKPCLHLHKGILAVSEKLATFIEKHHIRRLNVAGSRETKEPGIYDWVTDTLEKTKNILEDRASPL